MTTMTAQPDSAAARKAMIDSQLRTSGINEEFVLSRMITVPRENFLPEDKLALAYIDRAVLLDGGGHLASPLFYGKLLIEADPRDTDDVLIVEGGTGYLAQLVRPLVKSIETVSAADAAAGKLSSGRTFSLVMVDGAIEQLPGALAGSIAEDGRIVTGYVLRQVTRLASGRKVARQVALQPVEDLGIPILADFNKPKSWKF
ncbi:protein-L-isoaspartate O-methyltransferase [Erythrobacter sp. MTPC3]|uniref:protein-L-isoaspartate O-methyltransferase family protein n=1 Tax=Erythrobacter sp. MTPC3 TaxID=3056564 RepID=UPI0036F2C768